MTSNPTLSKEESKIVHSILDLWNDGMRIEAVTLTKEQSPSLIIKLSSYFITYVGVDSYHQFSQLS